MNDAPSGLLDFLATPGGQGLLSAVAGGLTSARRGAPLNTLGRAGIAGLTGYQAALSNQGKAQMQQMTAEKLRIANEQQQAERARQQEAQNALRQAYAEMAKRATAPGGVPNYAHLASVGVSPTDLEKMRDVLSLGKSEVKNIETIKGPDGAPLRVGIDKYGNRVADIGGKWVEPKTLSLGDRVASFDPARPDAPLKTLGKVGMSPAGQASLQLEKGKQAYEAMGIGQKGFDNALTLRAAFRSEPIYKAYQEVQSAQSQILAGLAEATPAGDLTAATKFMKILDPGSVVRESELDMAMQTTGLSDKISNYAKKIISGNYLSPKQREDFRAMANKLANESKKLYQSKRKEYGDIAERNYINKIDVIGRDVAPSLPQKTSDVLSAADAILAGQ